MGSCPFRVQGHPPRDMNPTTFQSWTFLGHRTTLWVHHAVCPTCPRQQVRGPRHRFEGRYCQGQVPLGNLPVRVDWRAQQPWLKQEVRPGSRNTLFCVPRISQDDLSCFSGHHLLSPSDLDLLHVLSSSSPSGLRCLHHLIHFLSFSSFL